MMSVLSELNLQQREGAHSEFNAAKVVVATAATLVNDIFEQTGMHALLKTTEQHFGRDDAKSATYYSEEIPLDNCLRAFVARTLAPIFELHEDSRVSTVEICSGFVTGEVQECMGIIRMNPHSAYLMAKDSRLEELDAMSKLELTKEASYVR